MADNQSPERFGPTPSQTVGPFFHYALPWRGGADLVGDQPIGARPELMPREHDRLGGPTAKGAVEGEVIVLEGVVRDGEGRPVPDALVEIWQADAQGRYAHEAQNGGFVGFGRACTDEEGRYRFRTVLPGATDDGQAPHVVVGLFGRGLLKRLVTRIYFAAAPDDPVMRLVPAARRSTLVARRQGSTFHFDIVLQGEHETVFFDV
jgi:protocatechuate 3,4-dioxygenase alpha subunit